MPEQQAQYPDEDLQAGRSKSEQTRRRKRGDASGPPPLDSPRPWRTEGLPRGDRASDKKKTPRWRYWVTIVALLIGLGLGYAWVSSRNAPPVIPYTEFIAQVEAGNVSEVYATGDTIQGQLRNEAKLPDDGNDSTSEGMYDRFTTERPTFAQDDLLAELAAHDAVVRATPLEDPRGAAISVISSLILWGLIIGLLVWTFRRVSRTTGMGPFGMQREVKPVERTKVRVNFSDVAGIDEVRDQVDEIVDFLKNPEKYHRVGARAPKGILLEGRPGTGKTLLARATAGEADVPFFSASAAEFIEMIVGVGAQRVRQLFDEAKKVAPAIIFIDEIDAIGRARGSGRITTGGTSEQEQTLNQILTEMDGFDGTEGVVVIGATNRSDVLDPALTRPGRFDRVITVSPPDQGGREKILGVHTRNMPLAKDVDLHAMALSTPGATGADLANVANEAALRAAKRGDQFVYHADFTNALEQIQLGVARSVMIPYEERRRTAYHEGGHALLGMLQKGADPVRKVSIIPRGQALGVTLSTPDSDRYGYDEEYLRGRIVGALGGMAAEAAIFGVVTSGAESDLRQATAIARQMVGKWGMSKRVGPVTVLYDDADPHQMGVSDQTLATVDEEVRTIISACHDTAVQLLTEHRAQLDAIAEALLEAETLDEDEVYRIAGIERPARPDQAATPGEDRSATSAPGGSVPPFRL